MNTCLPEKVTKAWRFAAVAHKDQKMINGNLPYIVHVGNVAMELMIAMTIEAPKHPDLALQCALLHDVIEDTEVTREQILCEFGEEVAAGVLALSKDKTLEGKTTQMKDSLRRICQQPKEVWMVKLADRIVNLLAPPHNWNKDKIARYRQEAILIYQQLQNASPILASRLLKKIEDYRFEQGLDKHTSDEPQ